jgi:hypothetical protein
MASSVWRWIPAGVLAAAAPIVGGVLGMLIGFLAALMLIDRLLERVLGPAGLRTLEADHAFRRLSRQRRRAAIERRLRGGAPDGDDLAYLAEDTGWVATAGRRQLGVVPIDVDSIVGTVDRHKAATFDRDFRPPDFSRGRWTLMFRAVRRGAALPPISVYRVGDEHYVRDGHHRVSVARATGADSIDAEVVELVRESPSRSPSPG